MKTIANLTTKGQERRDEILAAADVLFRQHGYEGTTLRMIAQQVGISCGHLEHYFNEKRDLLYSLSDLLIDNLWDGSEVICHEWNNDPYVVYAFATHWLFLVCSHLDDIRRVTFEYVNYLDNQKDFSERFANRFIRLLEQNRINFNAETVKTSVQMAFAAHYCNVQKYDNQNFSDKLAAATSRSHIEILFLLLQLDAEKAAEANRIVRQRIDCYSVERLVKPFSLTYDWYRVKRNAFKV